MSVVRIDLEKCVGCGLCVEVCPMDVMYLEPQARKAIIAYPECCQNCGQCCVYCPTGSIGLTNETYGYPLTAFRGTTTAPVSSYLLTQPGILRDITKGNLG